MSGDSYLLKTSMAERAKEIAHMSLELAKASERNDIESAKRILKEKFVDVNKRNEQTLPYGTPLFIACKLGNPDIVRLLLKDPRVDMNKKDGIGWTPLYVACHQNRPEVVRVLLNESRTDVNVPNIHGDTPLILASQQGFLEIVKMLLADPDIDVNQSDFYGRTALFVAADLGQCEVARLLLEDERVNVNKGNDLGITPLHLSCRSGNVELIKLLMDERTDANKADKRGLTPLFSAAYWKRTLMIKWILASGKAIHLGIRTEPGVKDWNDKSAEEIAAFHKLDEVSYYLAEYKANSSQTVVQIRKSLQLQGYFSSSIFVLLVLFSDGYLQIPKNPVKRTKLKDKMAVRFFQIGKQLPMDLQMVISLRFYGFAGDVVSVRDFNDGLNRFLRKERRFRVN